MTRRWLIIPQFWLTVSRLICALCGLVLVICQIQLLNDCRRNPPKEIKNYIIVPEDINFSVFVVLSFQLGVWISLIFNDLYMSTLDFKVTHTYMGCIAVQSSISAISVVVSIALIAFWMTCGWKIGIPGVAGFNKSVHYLPTSPPFFLYVLPAILGAVWSLCLLTIVVAGLSTFPRHRTQVWKYNAKDLIMGRNDSYERSRDLSFAGRCRLENIRAANEFLAPGNVFRRLLANALFRRVSPAETRVYAAIRNIFSIISIGIIIFRAVTALQKAQNEIGTRLVSDTCDTSTPTNRIDVVSDAVFPLSLRPQVKITANATKQQGSGACVPEGSDSILFTCEPNGQQLPGPTKYNYYRPTFYFEVRLTEDALRQEKMPSFWLVDRHERFSSVEASGVANDPSIGLATWLYTPSWQLRPGFHIEAEAQSVTRRFLTSSLIRDILLSSEPTYARTTLFPIVEVGVFALPNKTLATAALRVSRKPGYAYMRDSKAFKKVGMAGLQYGYQDLCTYINDYRESTILDAIGSIGGLFALLQAAHVLLFGRPMLWGLTGAKLITPFGLVAVLSSKGFRRRLRQEYYQQDTAGGPSVFQVGDFLRDFVIDLGPAESNQELPARMALPKQSSSISNSDKTVEGYVQVPFMPLEVRQTPSFKNSVDIDELSNHARETSEKEV